MSSASPFDQYYVKADGSAFSVAQRAVVPANDAQFEAWQATGGVPRPWPTDANGAQSDAALATALAPFGLSLPVTQASLASALITAAQAASTSITKQIATTETHLAGYQSAANMVQVAAGVPTADPAKTAFAELATAIGMQPAQLATLVLAMDAASVTNLAILATLIAATAQAKTAADLAAALTAYEASLGAFVAQLNAAGLTTAIAAPAAITIAGINA